MPDRIPCQFFLISYVPNVVTGKFVNIGVLLCAADSRGGALAEARFTRFWGQLLQIDPLADIRLLESLANEIRTRVRDEAVNQQPDDAESMIDLMRDSFSNLIQISEPQTSLAASFADEMDRLMHMYVESQDKI